MRSAFLILILIGGGGGGSVGVNELMCGEVDIAIELVFSSENMGVTAMARK